MNDGLELSLELVEQRARGFHFRLSVRNRAALKLLVPLPEVCGLRFVPLAGGAERQWGTSLLVSAAGQARTLKPDEAESFDWIVRPCAVERPPTQEAWDFYRWCIDLADGEYWAWYSWRVDGDFFDPDSHMRFPDLERLAEGEGATVWQGEADSNRLRITWGSRGPPPIRWMTPGGESCSPPWRS